jgi:hypothetical protein
MSFYSHLYSCFGLPHLSYFYFKHHYRGATFYGLLDFSLEQYLKLFKQQFSGLDFSFGYLFQAIPDVFGFKSFDGYSLYQSPLSRFFSTSTTLGPSIANGPYLTYCSIPFQELNLMVALVNLKTLHHFNGVDSIIIWSHVESLDTSIYQLNERLRAPVPSFTTVQWLISVQRLQFFWDIRRM